MYFGSQLSTSIKNWRMTLSPTSPISPTSLVSAQGASIPVVLRASKLIAPSVKELTFERCDGKPLEFAPGPWVNLLIPGASGEFKRAYSIASEPNGGPSFELAVTHVDGGPGSTHLHAMQPGDSLAILGPHGLFQRKGDRPTIFVGTGTGITPSLASSASSMMSVCQYRLEELVSPGLLNPAKVAKWML